MFFFLLKLCNEAISLVSSWSYILLLNKEQYLFILHIYLWYSIAYITCSNYRFTCVIRLTCNTCTRRYLLTFFCDWGTHDVYAWKLNSPSTLSDLSSPRSSILLLGHCCLWFYLFNGPRHLFPSSLSSSSFYYNFNITLPVVMCKSPEKDISLWGFIDLPPIDLDSCIGLSLLMTDYWTKPLLLYLYSVTIEVLHKPRHISSSMYSSI